MTFERAVQVFEDYKRELSQEADAKAQLLEFLEWEDPDEDQDSEEDTSTEEDKSEAAD